jgi:hypothetical protein
LNLTLKLLAEPVSIGGIAGTTAKYSGIIRWETLGDDGSIIQFRTHGLLVPELDCRLFSPQTYLHGNEDLGLPKITSEQLAITCDGMNWQKDGKTVMQIKYDSRTFLPRLAVFHAGTGESTLACMAGCVTRETNQNLSGQRRGKLQWHIKLGHLGFAHVTKLGKVASLIGLHLVSSLKVINPLLIVQLVILPDKTGNPLDTNMLLWTNPRSVGSTKTRSTLGILSSWTT